MNALPSIKARPDITPDRALRMFWLNGRAVPRTFEEVHRQFSASQAVASACMAELVRTGFIERAHSRHGEAAYDPTDAGIARAKALAGVK